MKVFLTGGTGLVGSHAIPKLTAYGHSVDALVRSKQGVRLVQSLGANPVEGDLQDSDLWQGLTHDAIVHSAAVLPKRGTWDEFESVNVHPTRLAAEAAARSGARLVHISSVAVYGTAGYAGEGSGSITEDTPFEQLHRFDHYGRSKRAAEKVLWDTVNGSPARAAALRPCVVYGERDRLFSPKMVGVTRYGVWPLAGNGGNTLTVIYAGNVADAICSCLEHPEATGAFNVTNDGGITQKEFFSQLARGAGHDLKCFPMPQPIVLGIAALAHGYKTMTSFGRYGGFVGRAARWLSRENPYSSAKAIEQLRWTPKVAPPEAAVRTGKWYAQ